MGEVGWTPTLKKIATEIKYWRLVNKLKQVKGKVGKNYLSRLQKVTKLPGHYEFTNEEVTKHLQVAYNEYKKYK